MRRFLLLLASGLGLGSLLRRRRQQLPVLGTPRRHDSLAPGAARDELTDEGPAGPDPADELRARLAEARTGVPEDADEELPLPIADSEESPLDPSSRRRALYDRTRAAIDELES